MYYIGLDVHKKSISYCVKDAAGQVHREGKTGSTRRELDAWIQTLPEPRMIAMEATIFTGWIYDHLLPHAEKVKVAHPLMLRAIAAAKKNDRIDARKIADLLRSDLLPECHMASTEIRDRRRTLRYGNLVLRQVEQMKNRVSGLLMESCTRWVISPNCSQPTRRSATASGHCCGLAVNISFEGNGWIVR